MVEADTSFSYVLTPDELALYQEGRERQRHLSIDMARHLAEDQSVKERALEYRGDIFAAIACGDFDAAGALSHLLGLRRGLQRAVIKQAAYQFLILTQEEIADHIKSGGGPWSEEEETLLSHRLSACEVLNEAASQEGGFLDKKSDRIDRHTIPARFRKPRQHPATSLPLAS
jgi:hypothetical protein